MKRLFLLGMGVFCIGAYAAGEPLKGDVAKLPPAAVGTMDFVKDIKPIFVRACVSCHGPDKQRSGLRLDHGEAALKGSNSGAVIVPGKAVESRLLHVVAGLDPDVFMPPKEKPALTPIEIGKLRAWIDQGAKWPKEASAVAATGSRHWAFQPIKKQPLPSIKNANAARNGVDYFILARLEAEKIVASPEADKATLIRRVTLDLTGVPPTPTEVDDFLNDTRPDAYERVVDRLLASPHYGERWGRHWLDLARYADSDGYEQDRERPFAWRYRNWVIDALNMDLPFDRFTMAQLAGDLLPGATLEQKIATGFHRNTLTNREGGTDKEQFRVEAVVDRVNTTFKVFFGLTFNCSQCHDHKYDPFSQREYYQIFAFFNSDDEVDLTAPLPGEEERFQPLKAAFDKKKAELQEALARYQKEELPAALKKWEQELAPDQRAKLPANVQAVLKLDKRNAKQEKVLLDYYGKTDKKTLELTKVLADHEKKAPAKSIVPTLALGKGRKTHILLRGDFLRPGIEVSSGTPAVLHPLKAAGKASRLDLAKWIVDPANPLTARVIVNWVWQRYFGRGLVATLEDFGTQGERPSHPELLDWLASEFMQPSHQQPSHEPAASASGAPWSLKSLHRLIVTSATYRQSSKARPELAARDPYNTLLARQNRLRLEAEIIRDSALAVSGLLVPTIGGPSVKPPQPPGISELTYANRVKWAESKGSDRYRRGMYTWFQRTSPYPMLMTFDAPDSNLCCVRREKSNTPLQALTLMNDAVFVECAQALARRILLKTASPAERLEHGFKLCLARVPTAAERQTLLQLSHDLLELCRSHPKEASRLLGSYVAPGADPAEAAAAVAIARTLLNLDEFVTRE